MTECKVSGCERRAATTGLCHGHYARWKRTGSFGEGPIGTYHPRGQTCSIRDCDKRASGRGWCVAHYERWRRYGDPLGRAPKRPPTHYSPERRAAISAGIQRAWSARTDRRHPADCGHCLATRGTPKPPRTQAQRDRISAAQRRRHGEPSYDSIHHARLRRDRGSPSDFLCPCGKPAREWALTNPPAEYVRTDVRGRSFSIRTVDYQPMCRSCHRAMDAALRGHAATA